MDRLEANEKIINHIQNYIRTYPDMRFGQVLYNMGIATHANEGRETPCDISPEHPRGVTYSNFYRDIFFEESDITLKKLIGEGRPNSTESDTKVSE